MRLPKFPDTFPVYSYERVAHVRVGALPVLGPVLRRMPGHCATRMG